MFHIFLLTLLIKQHNSWVVRPIILACSMKPLSRRYTLNGKPSTEFCSVLEMLQVKVKSTVVLVTENDI